MRQVPATITTEELHEQVRAGAGLWLVYAPDRAAFADGHIPGSVTGVSTSHPALFAGVPVVAYGEDGIAARARRLAVALAEDGAPARWYAGGLAAWAAAGLPVERLGR